ncbi:MAG: hypothetical protein AB7I04_24040 [Pseudomonadales bacterium]
MKALSCTLLAVLALAAEPQAGAADIPRTADGKPDLSGTYDIATVTPVERPQALGNQSTLTDEQVRQMSSRMAAMRAAESERSDPNREAPPVGGDGSGGATGNVGGYNTFWIDPGEQPFKLHGEFRTSIITDPPNGRRPAMTPQGQARIATLFKQFGKKNEGTAWWVGLPGPGPYDDPETLTLSDRCLTGFGSAGGPPVLPTLYNNLKRIVQTPDHVMILIEMVHDARIVRLNSEHADPSIRKWLGDSIGWWEGDTLVVDTTNFNDHPAQWGASRDLHVVERFRRIDADTLHYSFTVTDPNTWEAPWSGEYPWPETEDQLFEYACHEGNYAMHGILGGARLLESEAENAQNTSGGGE